MSSYPADYIPALSDESAEIRRDAAEWIIGERETELASLTAKLADTKDPYDKRRLRLRVKATTNHIQGWRDYISQGCPRHAPS